MRLHASNGSSMFFPGGFFPGACFLGGFFLGTLCAAGCRTGSPWHDAANGVQDKALAELCTDAWEFQMASQPVSATNLGDPRYCRTLWIAGHTGQVDDAGKSLAGDFDAQFHQCFRNIEKTLAEAGATLSDIVTMTVFLIDARHTTRMTELRGQLFGKDFPASAAITVQGFAQPEMMIEVQGIAVTG